MQGVQRISPALDVEFSRSRLAGGEVLLSIQGTVGRVALVPRELAGANISRTLAVIQPDDRLSPAFLGYALRAVCAAGAFKVGGTTRASLNISTIREMGIPLPPLAEQRRIVDLLEDHLSRIDRAWEYSQSAQRRLATLRACLLGQALGESHECLLGEVARVKSGFAFSSASWRSQGTPVIKIANVRNGRVDLSGCSFVDARTAATSADFSVTRGDLLITLTGEIGATGVYGSDFEARLNQRVGRIDVHRPDLLDRSFLRYALESSRCRVAMWAAAKGMAQPNISPREVEKLVIPLPSLERQRVIVGNLESWVSRLDGSDRLLASAFRKSAQLRRAILHASFSGQLLSASIPETHYV